MLQSNPPQKSVYKEHILTCVTAFHETELRKKAKGNLNMTYLNVSGLRGRRHSALFNMTTTIDVQKSRPHLKLLCNVYFTYEKRASQSGGSPHCRSCSVANRVAAVNSQPESLSHILTECTLYTEIRDRILPEFEELCQQSKSGLDFTDISCDINKLDQFILDPTSLNLHSRISNSDPKLGLFFQLSRDYCFCVHKHRMKILNKKSDNV